MIKLQINHRRLTIYYIAADYIINSDTGDVCKDKISQLKWPILLKTENYFSNILYIATVVTKKTVSLLVN